jgi:hypothetical protein
MCLAPSVARYAYMQVPTPSMKAVPSLQPVTFWKSEKIADAGCLCLLVPRTVMKNTKKPIKLHRKKKISPFGIAHGRRITTAVAMVGSKT